MATCERAVCFIEWFFEKLFKNTLEKLTKQMQFVV